MNSGSVRGFLPTLRKIEQKLTLPIPDRIRILRELEFDLEELRAKFVAEGIPPGEAHRRALETLAPDPGSLRELARVHGPLYRRITEHLSESRLKTIERSALVMVTGLTLAGQTLALLRADLLRAPSPFLWPVLGLGGVLAAVIVAAVFGLIVKGDHRVAEGSLKGVLPVSGSILGLGIGGAFTDFYRLTGILETTPELAATLTPLWLLRDCSLLSVSLLLALGGGLIWKSIGFIRWPLLLSFLAVAILAVWSAIRLFRPGASPDLRTKAWLDAIRPACGRHRHGVPGARHLP